jgi:predicted nucleic acid-binding Zn finger protein
MNPVQQAESLLKKFEPLHLSDTLDIIYYLGEQNDDIIFKNRATTPDKLLNQMYSGCHPRCVHISFWGGPPKFGRWVQASFYAYLLDRIARIVAEYGFDCAKRALRVGIRAAKG